MKVKLTRQKVIDKEFNANIRGYKAIEVDEFLDIVADDYSNFERDISELSRKYEEIVQNYELLKNSMTELEAKNAILQEKVKNITDDSEVSLSNIDLLNRIQALESALFKAGIDPTKIK